MKKLLLALVLLAGTAHATPNRWGQLWYSPTSATQCDSAAARYKIIVCGIDAIMGPNATHIKHANSAVRMLAYITTDLDPSAGSVLAAKLAEETSDVEGCFLHYQDDTSIYIAQQPTLEAWDYPAGSKVTVRRGTGFATLSYAMNFSTAAKRSVWRRAMVRFIKETPYPRGTEPTPDVYASGIFLDNAGADYNSVPDVCKTSTCTLPQCDGGHYCSGGHVTEAGGLQIKENDWQVWWRTEALNKFAGTLNDTLKSLGLTLLHNVGPQPGAFKPFNSATALPYTTLPNWGNIYTEFTQGVMYQSYANGTGVDTSYVRYVRARENALASDSLWSFHSPHMTRSDGTYTWTYGEIIRSNMAFWLVVRNDSTVFFHQGANHAVWDSIIWSPCQRTVQKFLGEPNAAPTIKLQGTDPTGKAFAVWGRRYTKGWALVRPRHGAALTIEPATAVTVVLSSGADFWLVHPDGTYGDGAGSFPIRNGQGIIVLEKSKVPPPEEIEEP